MTNFNFFNFCSSLFGSWNKDLTYDCRLTVGSPSGEYCSSLLKLVSVLVLILTIGVGNAWGTYTITFNGSNSESTSISTSTTAASITGSSTYVTGNVATATKVYGATSDGIKLGASSNAGTIKINLSASGQVTPTSIVVNCKLYNSSKSATLKVNGSATQSVPSSSGNLTFNITSAITYIQLESSKYIWVKSVTVNTATTKTFTLAVPKGDGTYDETQTGQSKTALTEANAIKKRSCSGGDLEGTYMGIWVTSAITKASNTTTYPASYVTSSTSDASLPAASKLYPVFYIYPYYFTDPRCETFNVLYDGNGNNSGSEPEDNTNYAYNATVTVKTNSGSLAKTGYSFNGWNTKADGTGTHFSATPTLGTFSITQDTMLYAEWSCANAVSIAKGTESNCSISFSSASVSTCSGTRQVTVSVTPSSCYAAPVKASVTSTGTTATWVSGPTLNSGHYDYVYSFAENATGTATFSCSLSTKTTYTVSYAKGDVPSGGGSIDGSHANDTKTCGTNMELPAASFTTTGYTQTGWSKTNGGSQYAAVSGSYTDDAAQTFYPVWTANKYIVTWSVNGNESTISPTTNVTYNTTTTAPTVDPSPCGTFMGWTTSENASYSHVSDAPSPLFIGTTPPITGDVTFYAVFADEN